ncbi:hypothetical protein ABES80_02105 [Bacillus gobiensis]|uniref:hypothetical protein n=1 Tax=Bacillus gobiensis TaxID=1441095 RepID=UPI003D1F654C
MFHYFPYYHPFYPVIFIKPQYYRHPALPPVNPQIFMKSAKQSTLLLKQAEILVLKLSSSPDLSKNIMAAAQESKEKIVLQLLKQTGVTSDMRVMFNPDGIHIELSQSNEKVTLFLRWSLEGNI